MLCLHGKPAVLSTTENGTIWTCGEPSTCFVCSRGQKQSYDKAIKAFLATKQDRPVCCGIVPATKAHAIKRYWTNYHKYSSYTETTPDDQYNPYKNLGPYVSAADVERCYAKFVVYTGKEFGDDFKEENIGRPFFACGNGTDRNPWGCGYFEWGDKNIITKPLCHHGTICRVDDKPGRGSFFLCTKKVDDCDYFKRADPSEDPTSKKKKKNEKAVTSEQREDPWTSY